MEPQKVDRDQKNEIQKKWNLSERKKELPREKILSHGPESLEDYELLAILLGTGTKKQNVLQLSKELLDHGELTLNDLAEHYMDEFQNFEGIKEAKASRLMAAMEIANRVYRQRSRQKLQSFTSVAAAGEYLMGRIGHCLEERFLVLILNNKNRKVNSMEFIVEDGSYVSIGKGKTTKKKAKDGKCEFSLVSEDEVSKGTVNQTFALPREVFRKAIRLGATSMILAHNHPSGDVTPSREDHATTKRLEEAGKIMGIKVLDHFVVGRNEYYSFKEHGDL
ncbi:MAG: JAB domain-containing protein [Tissierellia bacterium]|nr:JAB domain-containing protein [Tissierellia bacterium]